MREKKILLNVSLTGRRTGKSHGRNKRFGSWPTATSQRLTAKVKPTRRAVWQAENEPVLDGGNPPRPFRHLRMAEHRTPDHMSSRVPVHSVLVQQSVTT